MSRFETEMLTTRKNLKAMMDLSGKWIHRVRQPRSLDKLILEMNSSVREPYGHRDRQVSPNAESLSAAYALVSRLQTSTGRRYIESGCCAMPRQRYFHLEDAAAILRSEVAISI